MPDSLKGIKYSAFANCNALASVIIGDGVEEIGGGAFSSCGNLTTVALGKNVKIIGGGAFSSCSKLATITFGDNVEQIGKGAFSNSSLRSVTLPHSVKEIQEGAFQYCYGLRDVVLSEGLETIGWRAFEFSGISRIIFPSTIIKLDAEVLGTSYSGEVLLLSDKVEKPDLNYYAKCYQGNEIFQNENIECVYNGISPLTFKGAYSKEIEEQYDIKCLITSNAKDVGVYNDESATISFIYKGGTCTFTQPMSYTVTPAPLTISCPAYTREYGQENPEFIPIYEGFVNNDDESVLSVKPTIATEAKKDSGVGEYAISVFGAEAQNYDISYNAGKIIITPAQQDIEWNQDISDAKIGDVIELDAVSSCGLPVTYTSSNPEIALIDGNKVTFLADGNVTITALQEGDKNHEAATPIEKNVEVKTTGIVMTPADENSINIYTVDNNLCVDGLNGRETSVYSTSGNLIYKGTNDRISLTAGLYIVKVGDIVKKVRI